MHSLSTLRRQSYKVNFVRFVKSDKKIVTKSIEMIVLAKHGQNMDLTIKKLDTICLLKTIFIALAPGHCWCSKLTTKSENEYFTNSQKFSKNTLPVSAVSSINIEHLLNYILI